MKSDRIFSNEIATVNQILPHVHKWAWDFYLNSLANNWVPTQVSMNKDIEQWRNAKSLTDDERLVVRRCLGFFAGSESLVSNNLLLTVFRWVSDAECRQYILRQSFEESLHNHTIVYICDSLGLNIDEVYAAYKNVPSIKAKDDFLMQITKDVNQPTFDINSTSGRSDILRNLITFYMVCEGMFFYSGFAMLLSFGRQNKLPGISEQIQYTLRDESTHLAFGTKLINVIIEQNPELWTEQFKTETIEHIKRASELELEYVNDVLPRGVLGLNAKSFTGYMHFISNRPETNLQGGEKHVPMAGRND
jgi:ribonucleoside-diphosphate reductase beta chain